MCVELEGHEDCDLSHLWVGGRHDLNLCVAEPVSPDGPASERTKPRAKRQKDRGR